MAVLAAGVLMLAAFQTASAAPAANPASDGLKALDEHRYQDAARDFERVVASAPSDFTAHFNLALSYTLLQRDDDAVTEYKKTLELKPGLREAQLNLGIVLLRQKKAAEALPYLTDARKQKAQDFRANAYLGDAQLDTGDNVGAQASFEAALAINPQSALAELGLARALARQKRLADAAPHFERAAALDVKLKDAPLELASLYEEAKQPAGAIAIYQRFPDNPGAQERLGTLLIGAGRFSDAIPPLQYAVKHSPTIANKMALATAYIKSHQPAMAAPLVDEALAANPRDYELRMLRGRLLRDDRKFPEAAREFTEAAQIKPDSAEAYSELAGVLVLAEDYQGAMNALDRLHALNAEKPGHFFLRAIVLDKFHQIKPAIDNYQRFLALDNGHSPDEDFQARQRVRILERELSRR